MQYVKSPLTQVADQQKKQLISILDVCTYQAISFSDFVNILILTCFIVHMYVMKKQIKSTNDIYNVNISSEGYNKYWSVKRRHEGVYRKPDVQLLHILCFKQQSKSQISYKCRLTAREDCEFSVISFNGVRLIASDHQVSTG